MPQYINDSKFTLQTRTGNPQVDASSAIKNNLSVLLFAGQAVQVQGNYDPNHVLHAETVLRAKELPDMWLEDR